MWDQKTFHVSGTLQYYTCCSCPHCEGCQTEYLDIDTIIDAHDEDGAAEKLLESGTIHEDIDTDIDDLLEQLTFRQLNDGEAVYQKNLRSGHPTLFDLTA